MTRIIIAGPGRAGVALGLASVAAGHDVVGVTARTTDAAVEAATVLNAYALAWGDQLPGADLLIVAVRDDAIADVAAHLAPLAADVAAAVHLSGLKSVAALEPLAVAGLDVGSIHPLQTLPTAQAGAARLPGAYAAITAGEEVAPRLEEFAASLGMHPFRLADEKKAVYHAGAAAAANFPLAALAMASDLLNVAGVPFAAAAPLVRAIVENAFEFGPRAALTGPVARGDVGTVAAQLGAVRQDAPGWEQAFADFVRHLAAMTGHTEEMGEVIG